MKRFGIISFAVLMSGACQREDPNKFSDPVVLKIAIFQDRRLSDSLYQFFLSENPTYRAQAAFAFASIQDTAASQSLGNLLLEDPDSHVRVNAAFALGQTGGIGAINALIPSVTDRDGKVVRETLEALGRVVERRDLNILTGINSKDDLVLEGLAWSFYRIGSRDLADATVIRRANEFLEPRYNQSTRLGAAHFFSRSVLPPLAQDVNLIHAALRDSSSEVRAAAAGGLMRLENKEKAMATLQTILETETDYRVRVNAVRCLRSFPWSKTGKLLIKALGDSSLHVKLTVSEVVESVLNPSDSAFFIAAARQTMDVRLQANLYRAVFAAGEYPATLMAEVKQKYKTDTNEYNKAHLLSALSRIPDAYSFIYDELMTREEFVLKSTAAEGLTTINRNKHFQPKWKPAFAEMYRQAIRQGDPAVIGIISEALADPVLGYKDVVKDLTFLQEAKKHLGLPKDIESLQPLVNAIAYFEGHEKPRPLRNEFNHDVDWESVKKVLKHQRAVVRTKHGDIILRLFVEESPGSVANFIDLIGRNYFNGKYVHRVVPNFVIQTGCNRGDGFGSEAYSIRSEFSGRRYRTGSVGMASAGKDTEGTQWFITHAPTPHLDGRYTVFAEVEEGMAVVDKIMVGDQIISASLMKN